MAEENIRLLNNDFATILQKLRDEVENSDSFKDYNYEGSFISTFLRQIAYVAELHGYNINQAASEAHLPLAKAYENANMLAKMLSYDPSGHVAPNMDVTFDVYYTAESTTPTTWFTGTQIVIPKYTNFKSSGISPLSGTPIYYTTIEDVVLSLGIDFTPVRTDTPNPGDPGIFSGKWTFNQKINLVNGFWERIDANSNGFGFQQLVLDQPSSGRRIADGYVDVYVKNEVTGIYEQWTRVKHLSDSDAYAKVYELRFNEHRKWEVTFGDGVNGVIPTQGQNTIQVYRLATDYQYGRLGRGFLTGSVVMNEIDSDLEEVRKNQVIDGLLNGVTDNIPYINIQSRDSYQILSSDFIPEDNEQEIIDSINALTSVTSKIKIYIRQETPSSAGAVPETVFNIRMNAPRTFSMQGAINSISDYYNYFAQNYRDIIHDVHAMNNWEYMTTYMAEYYRTGGYGIESPYSSKILGSFRSNKANVLQMDSADFNNVYVVSVPKIGKGLSHPVKERIIKSIRPIRNACTETIILDPVYTYILPVVIIKKDQDAIIADAIVESRIAKLIRDYFILESCKLGQTIEISSLKQQILEIKGVDSIIYMNMFYKDNYDFTESEKNEIILEDYTAIQDNGLLYNGRNYDYKISKFKFPVLSSSFDESINSLNKGVKVKTNTSDTLGYTEY